MGTVISIMLATVLYFATGMAIEFDEANPSHVTEVEGQDDGDGSTLKVVLLGSEWNSLAGGISTLNRELAIHLAEDPKLKVTVLVPEKSCKDEEKREARRYGVTIVDAEELPGYHPLDWLSFPPKDLGIDIVVGHGAKLGRQGQVIRNAPQRNNCKWVQLVHTASEDLGKFKNYNNPISQGERKHQIEVDLCKRADLVVPIGPRLEEFYSSYLRRYKKDIFTLTPGLFAREFGDLEQASGDNAVFRVLIFGRGDLEDFELKGYNIAAEAFTDQRLKKKPNYQLIFVGAPDGKQDEVAEKLVHCGIAKEQLDVRGFVRSREKMKDILCEVDLAVMPSKSEGFGLVALEALSAGLPILVGSRSGIAKALENVPNGDKCIVNSDDPAKWAEAIEAVHVKHRMRLKEIKVLQDSYSKMYSWKEQCRALVERMRKMVHVRSVNYCDDNTFGRHDSILNRQVEINPNFQKMQRELQELKEEVSKKDDEKIKREKEIKENEELHEEKIFKLSDELKNTRKKMEDYKTSFQKMQRKLQELKEEISKKDDETRTREREAKDNEELHKEKISKLIDELKYTRKKMEDYETRLASSGGWYVEDLRTRPCDLKEQFAMFCDCERLDVYDAMTSIFRNTERDFCDIFYPRLACIILETAYEQARKARIVLFKELTRIMVDNAAQMGTNVVQNRKWSMEGKDPQEVLKACVMEEPTKFQKDAIDRVLFSMQGEAVFRYLDNLVEGLIDKVYIKWSKWFKEDESCVFTPDYQSLKDRHLDLYSKACLRLSWLIVTHVPPMNLEYQTLKFNTNIHKKSSGWRSFKGRAQENQEEDIACYLWPGLQDGEGRVIRTGEVVCVIQEKEKSR